MERSEIRDWQRSMHAPDCASVHPSYARCMSKPAGKCLFCGGGGVTKGHVWADWLKRTFPDAAQYHEHFESELFPFQPQKSVPKSTATKQGSALARKPRNTCAKCNNGWMGRIENSVIPIATPLILGKPNLIRVVDQWLLASFLCLVSMRVALLARHPTVIPQQDRDWLRIRGCPPNDWQIWITRLKEDQRIEDWTYFSPMQRASQSSSQKEGSRDACNTQVTTMVIGHLCAHLFSSTVWLDFAGYEGIHMTQIWPPGQFDIDSRWLPIVTDEVAKALHRTHEREALEMASKAKS